MKSILIAVLISVALATPSFAAKLYLKDGGIIPALRIWRANGKVHVLVTRHTQTSFEPYEIDLKRTFARRHKAARKSAHIRRQTATVAPNKATAAQKPVRNKTGVSLPDQPKRPERKPGSLVPSSGSDGTIRQHKKEMAERAAE